MSQGNERQAANRRVERGQRGRELESRDDKIRRPQTSEVQLPHHHRHPAGQPGAGWDGMGCGAARGERAEGGDDGFG